jgi:hypothetical protein
VTMLMNALAVDRRFDLQRTGITGFSMGAYVPGGGWTCWTSVCSANRRGPRRSPPANRRRAGKPSGSLHWTRRIACLKRRPDRCSS